MCLAHPFSIFKCGHCFECLQDRRRDWSLRLLFDSRHICKPYIFHLTYSPENLPLSKSGKPTLCKNDIQLFFKRLRHEFPKSKLSYFLCGEYSPSLARPHYHCCLFGIPEDFSRYKVNEILQKAWTLRGNRFGHVLYSSRWLKSDAQIHYVTKYMLNWIEWSASDDRVRPFNFISKDIGSTFPEYAKEKNLFPLEIQNLFKRKLVFGSSRIVRDSVSGKFINEPITTGDTLCEEVYHIDPDTHEIILNPILENFRDFVEVSHRRNDGTYKTYRYNLPRYWSEKVYTQDFRKALNTYKELKFVKERIEYEKLYGEYDKVNPVPMWKQIKLSRFEQYKKKVKDKSTQNPDLYLQ